LRRAWSVRLYVCLYVRLSHSCTLLKPLDGVKCHLVGDTSVVLSNTVLDRGSGLHGKGRFGDRNPQMFAPMSPIAKLLSFLFTAGIKIAGRENAKLKKGIFGFVFFTLEFGPAFSVPVVWSFIFNPAFSDLFYFFCSRIFR